MTKNILRLAAALAVIVASMTAQIGVVTGSPFQQASQLSTGVPQPRGGVQMTGAPQPATSGDWVTLTTQWSPVIVPAVVGKPFSATEEQKTVQTLGDGTQLENSDRNLFYRDSQGRTRVERTTQGRTTITISDPVAHTTVMLDPATKSARKNGTVGKGTFFFAGRNGTQGGTRGGPMPQVTRSRGGTMTQSQAEDADAEAFAAGVAGRGVAGQNPPPTSEELGVETVNGVASQGTRNTQIIPAGRIGNNRDIHVVNERWYSNDLQMLVKTVNSDPRFGVTTYQLTNIVQGAQEPALFQIPADYTVVEPGR